MTNTVTDKVKKIKASLAFTRLPDADAGKQFEAIIAGMTGSLAFINPPIDIPTFKKEVESFNTLVTDALDGGKKVVAAKRKQRVVVNNMATQLAHYVEAVSNNDLATFKTSGFIPANNTRTPAQPLLPATFKWIDRGPNSGQISLKVTGLKGAFSYEVRYAVAGSGATPGPWTNLTLMSLKAVTINNLAPGSTYIFQVRALGKLGYSDWSDSMTFICA